MPFVITVHHHGQPDPVLYHEAGEAVLWEDGATAQELADALRVTLAPIIAVMRVTAL